MLLEFSGNKLSLRDFSLLDIPAIDLYWASQTPADLQRMYIDPLRIPKMSGNEESIAVQMALPFPDRKTDVLIWELNGKAIGTCTLRNIRFGNDADIHLHVFQNDQRQKGFGQRFFAMSVLKFAERFELKTVICQPCSTNPGPNRLLSRLGVPIQKTYRTTPSLLCFEHEVNHYEMGSEAFERFRKLLEPEG